MNKKTDRKLRIGIDIDNVISDSFPAYLKKFNENFATNFKAEDMLLVNNFPEIKGVDRGKVDKFIDKLIFDFDFQLSLPPFKQAKEVIESWQKKGHHLHYITARPVHIERVTRKWLQKHGFIKDREVLKMSAYFDSQNPPSKTKSDPEYKKEVVDEFGIKLLIEDHLEVARIMDIEVILIDRAWNQGELPQNVVRVTNWYEIEELICKLFS